MRGLKSFLIVFLLILSMFSMTFPVVIAPDVDYTVGQSSDDCHEKTDGTIYSHTVTTQYIGKTSVGNYYNSSFRFQNVNIPRNSTITSAYLRLHAQKYGSWGFPTPWHHYEIHCIDEDNTTTFSSGNKPSNRTLTENKTDWDWQQSAIQFMFSNANTPDISDAVEEVINRYNPATGEGWNDTGNALAVVICDDSSQLKTYIHSYDYNGGSNPAVLYITYVPPGNVAPNEPILPVPVNNAYPVDRTPTLKVNVSDDNEDNLYVYWFSNESSWGYETIRPEANGTGWNLSVHPVDDENYDAVDDVIPNNDADYVYVEWQATWLNDTYIMQDISGRTEGINSITVYGYIEKAGGTQFPYNEDNRYKFVIFDNNTWSYGSEIYPTTDWEYGSYTWTTNPNNESNPWTWDDIDNMEIGVALIGDQIQYTKCTQLYATVNYSDLGEHYFTCFHNESGVSGTGTDVFAVASNFLEPYTDYWWYVNVTDGALYNQSETFHVKTGGHSTWAMVPSDEDYNETSPSSIGVNLTSPSGLDSDVYIYSWNTTSSGATLLDTLTNVGNGTQTTSWSCGDGTKRFYCYIDTGNFTNTTDITSFFCNDVWSDTFWDIDFLSNYSSEFDIGYDSFINSTKSSADYESFETDYGDWADGLGSERSTLQKHTGSYSVLINNVGDYFYFEYDSTVYTNVSVDFWGYAYRVESDDFLNIEYYDGVATHQMYHEEWDGDESTWLHGGIANTGQKWYVDEAWTRNSNAQIWFQMEHGAAGDSFYIDTVWVNMTGNVYGNFTSVTISLPPNHYWSHFNTDVSDRDNVTFSILNGTDDSVLISNLDGYNNDVTNLSPSLGENSTVKLFAEFIDNVSMDSWNISWSAVETSVDTIVPYNNSNYPLNMTASGATDLDNVTLWYRYSPGNSSWGNHTGYVVQRGIQKMPSGTTTNTVTIDSVDLDHAFVLAMPYMRQRDANPGALAGDADYCSVTCYLSDSTTVIFEREASDQDIVVDWQILECLDNEFTVQRGEKTFTNLVATSTTDTINAVTPSNTMAWHTMRTTYQPTDDGRVSQFTSNVTDATTMTFTRQLTTSITGAFRWVAVEWDTSKIDSFQIGDIAEVDTETDGSPYLYTLSTSIGTSDSILLFQQRAIDSGGLDSSTTAGYIKDSDECGFYKHSTVNGATIHLYVIDFGSACGSRYENIHEDELSTWGGEIYNIGGSVDLTRSLSFVSGTSNGDGTAKPRHTFVSNLVSSSGLAVYHNYTGQACEVSWQVLELPYVSVSDSVNGTFWIHWNDTSNPDLSYPWSWDFDFPYGAGYYEFYSVGNRSGETESAPGVADARCNYSVFVYIPLFERSVLPLMLSFSLFVFPFWLFWKRRRGYNNVKD